MTLALLLGSMLGLVFLGVPLAFALLGASLLTLLVTRPGLPLEVVPQFFIQGMDNFPLLAIALFFLAGELMVSSGVTRRILAFAQAIVGHLRGGLAQVGIIASFVMAGVSGSAVADAAAVGSVLIRSMKQAGYPAAFSAAVVATASILGPIIPPSIPMIIYAVLAGVSVGGMFLAGVVPGILIALGLAAVAHRRAGQLALPRTARADRATVARETGSAFFALLAPLIIVGGIRGGVFTPTEAGAIAAVYVLAIGAAIYRGLDLSKVAGALVRAAHGTASVLVVLGASSIFAWIIADQGISRDFAATITGLGAPPWLLILLFNLMFLAIGMFLDPIAALIILVPIMIPLLPELALAPIQFGVMIVLNLMIGMCTPPVGYLIFITGGIAEVPAGQVVRQSLPFLAVLLVVLGLVSYVPAITLTLPRLIAGG
ncbi:TRAP transporter large permease [Kaustia mangrovi]|uniref:TRAP transporter large permease protein n=1 Tax=Kaustia mangrovi TaxID=2593653 RepID=A0A7S8C3H1_9HYPH|nr:TRAP transporter large permease [Kaustia mangrovi]QPC42709.1 TRAP transporter large permease [Kaustia mangrovi]